MAKVSKKFYFRGSFKKNIFCIGQEADAGIYTCIAQNSAGVALNDIVLDVLVAPQVTVVLPNNGTATAGQVYYSFN